MLMNVVNYPLVTLVMGFGLVKKFNYVKQCELCGMPFQSVRSDAKYCSARCRNRKARTGLKWNRRKICVVCRGSYIVDQPNQPHMYCSAACKQKAYRERKREKEGWINRLEKSNAKKS